MELKIEKSMDEILLETEFKQPNFKSKVESLKKYDFKILNHEDVRVIKNEGELIFQSWGWTLVLTELPNDYVRFQFFYFLTSENIDTFNTDTAIKKAKKVIKMLLNAISNALPMPTIN